MNTPFIVKLSVKELEDSIVFRADAELAPARNAPAGLNLGNHQAFALPVESDRAFRVGDAGIAFDNFICHRAHSLPNASCRAGTSTSWVS